MELLELVLIGCTSQELLGLHIVRIPPPNDAYPSSCAAQAVFLGHLVFPVKKIIDIIKLF